MFVLLALVSCSFLKKGDDERLFQTKVLSIMNEKAADFGLCAKKARIYKKLNKKRIRTVVFLKINKQGNLDQFKLDDQSYPAEFSSCIFDHLDLIKFPKHRYDAIEIEQPFIFSKK